MSLKSLKVGLTYVLSVGIGVLFGDASEELTSPVLGLCPINCAWDPFSGIGPFSLV